ncbi:MAG: type II methionyl aminopeptidase [Candidatus Pacearchaeota archaeon]
MTEKSYGGKNGVREYLEKNFKLKNSTKEKLDKLPEEKKNKKLSIEKNSNLNEIESYIKAGKIAKEVRDYSKLIIKKDMLLLDIARKIEAKILELGGEPAFPVNLSIDDIAAHYHPTIEDKTKASGLLKIDLGVHINGFIADTSFSLDLSEEKKYTELIKASEQALDSALNILEKNPTLHEIGSIIQKEIQKKGFSPIVNLCGHGLGNYNIHSGITIPNHGNNNQNRIEPGSYAIEPFATTGEGRIYEGPPSNIFVISKLKNPRSQIARKILEYVNKKYRTLPFSLREIQENFGLMAKLAIKELEQNKIIHSYPQLIEVSHKPVSQAEHTFIKTKDNKIIIITK